MRAERRQQREEANAKAKAAGRRRWQRIAIALIGAIAIAAGVWVAFFRDTTDAQIDAKVAAARKQYPDAKRVTEKTANGTVTYLFDSAKGKVTANLRNQTEALMRTLPRGGASKTAIVHVRETAAPLGLGLATTSVNTEVLWAVDRKVVTHTEKAKQLATVVQATGKAATVADLVGDDAGRRALDYQAKVAASKDKKLDEAAFNKLMAEPLLADMNASNFALSKQGLTILDDQGKTVTTVALKTITPFVKNATAQQRKGKVIALTFDDGPNDKTTPTILKTLADNDVKATFFMVGTGLEYFPETGKAVQAAGHEIGEHTYNHHYLPGLADDQIQQEVNGAMAKRFYDVLGVLPTTLRPPYGAVNTHVASMVDMPAIQWGVDSQDWESKNAAAVTQRVVGGAYPGAIVLMHDTQPASVEALPTIIAQLKEQGYTFVTVSELLGDRLLPGYQYFGRGDERPI